MSEPQNKRKKPNYYIQKKRKQFILEPGLKGFLCSCNFREKECIRESYNLLNQYADSLNSNTTGEIIEESVTTESDSDITEELSKEINSIKDKPTEKRFQVVESGAKNLLFIRTTVENPTEVVLALINDIILTKTQKTRYLLRLIPIENTCKATMDDIKNCIEKLIDIHFSNDAKTFAVAFNHRNNQQLNRDDVIKEVASLITSKNSKHKVDLKNPELTVIVEIIRGMCLLSIIPDYNKYKKYNLLQIFESINKKFESEHSETNE